MSKKRDCRKCFADMRCQKTGKNVPCDEYVSRMPEAVALLKTLAKKGSVWSAFDGSEGSQPVEKEKRANLHGNVNLAGEPVNAEPKRKKRAEGKT